MKKPGVTKRGFYSLLTDAVNDITENGFSIERMKHWVFVLRGALETSSTLKDVNIRRILLNKFKIATSTRELVKLHPGVPRYTLDMIAPRFRAELDSRIIASSDLIKLNRDAAIEKTIQRFSGWSTSIPESGSKVVDKIEVKENIIKEVKKFSFEERRVSIDQGHKMIDAVNEAIAKQTNAIAGIWKSNFRQAGYDYREDHKERSGKIYLIRGCWALEQGLIRKGSAPYMDEITRPGEEVFCRCYYIYLSSLRDLPVEMFTEKGKSYFGIK